MIKKKWNGPEREFRGNGEYKENECYCVTCGNIYVWTDGRQCPTCSAYHYGEELERRIDELWEHLEEAGLD